MKIIYSSTITCIVLLITYCYSSLFLVLFSIRTAVHPVHLKHLCKQFWCCVDIAVVLHDDQCTMHELLLMFYTIIKISYLFSAWQAAFYRKWVFSFLFTYFPTSIHPFFKPAYSNLGSRGGWSLSQQSLGERRGTPWTGRQSITGPHRDRRDTQPCMLTPTRWDNLESPMNSKLTWCFWTVGGSQSTQGEHANSTQKGLSRESCCEATALTTTASYSPYFPTLVQNTNLLAFSSRLSPASVIAVPQTGCLHSYDTVIHQP